MKLDARARLAALKARLQAIGVRRALIGAGIAAGVLLGAAGIGLAVMIHQLPEIDQLSDYRPKQPLRVYTADGVEIGQFGAERRVYVPIADIPKRMQDALLAIEDRRFREHGGVDVKGVFRAVFANLTRSRSQGASTITQQVARTFYLSSRKTYRRKLREMLLAIKIERQLTKDQVLELYMNQIFLGQRAYGFEAASHAYFGKTMADLSTAEVAMLAGLPQNPVHANPVSDPGRARKRQLVVLDAMESAGVITAAEHRTAQAEPLHVKRSIDAAAYAEHAAEMARQAVFARYGQEAYTLGLRVYTSLDSREQEAAYRAVRKGVLDFDRRQPYRGPEDNENLPDNLQADDPEMAELLADREDDAELRVALVTEASPDGVKAVLATGETVLVTGNGLRIARTALSSKAKASLAIRRGSVIRVVRSGKSGWAIAQWPQIEAALAAVDPHNGRMRALIGGFDFSHNQFNHASQAARQPGSSFKPFVYSAALEHGVMPATQVNDAPLDLSGENVNGWEPKNSDGSFDGPMTLRQGLARSKNLVSIRVLQQVGVGPTLDWVTRFGFARDKLPDNLTLTLGTGVVTPLQLASAYAVIANGGLRVEPQLIERIVDASGQTVFETPPPANGETDAEADPAANEARRAIPARNAWLTGQLLNEVTRSGTAARAQAALGRSDLYGKTGTTNDAVDAWFAGYQPGLVAVVWMGYDTPRSLGSGESGGGLSLPVWIDFMRVALKGVKVASSPAPAGVVEYEGDWVYDEWAEGGFVTGIGIDTRSWWERLFGGDTPMPGAPAASAAEPTPPTGPPATTTAPAALPAPSPVMRP